MNSRTKVLVTGASGFIGRAIIEELKSAPDYCIVSASRSHERIFPEIEHWTHDLLNSRILPNLSEVDTVVHTAARVHITNDKTNDKLAAFRATNVTGTKILASAAAAAGVRRFIYLSSIKVNGETTYPGLPFTVSDRPAPQDPYGISKYEAELSLREIERKTGLEVVIVRPPLVYGPGVKANFQTMMGLVQRGIPLPFGAIDNQRSLVALNNLVDLLTCCIKHEAAAGRTFLVSDGEDQSTPQLIRSMAEALGRSPRLMPIPKKLLSILASCCRKKSITQRLCDSLQVDIAYTRRVLDWAPRITFKKALAETANAYILERKLKEQ